MLKFLSHNSSDFWRWWFRSTSFPLMKSPNVDGDDWRSKNKNTECWWNWFLLRMMSLFAKSCPLITRACWTPLPSLSWTSRSLQRLKNGVMVKLTPAVTNLSRFPLLDFDINISFVFLFVPNVNRSISLAEQHVPWSCTHTHTSPHKSWLHFETPRSVRLSTLITNVGKL